MIKLLMKHLFSIAIVMACLAPGIGLAGLVGEPAPALNVSQWIKGQPVEIKPGTNIYVVEIWESTRPGCRAAITNLTDLQERYRADGVVVVGVSDEPAEKIKKFVEQSGTNIDYEIAADNKRYTSLGYMEPVMQRGIPYVFVVGTNGDLLWHGSPFRGLDRVLELVTSGAYDEELAKKMDLATHQMAQYLNLARQGSDRAHMAARTLLANRTNDVPLLCQMAETICTLPNLPNRDFALADQALDRAEQLAPSNSVSVVITRAIWLFESGQQDAGLARATQALAFAQSPLMESNVQACIRTMQARRSAHHQNNAKPDASSMPGPDSGLSTNQNTANQTGPGASAPGKL
jgi:hypothetical protein